MLKKLKSLFIVEDDSDKKSASDKSQSNPESESKTPVPEPVPEIEVNIEIPEIKDPQGKPDPKFVDILLKAIEKNNMDGFDYLEYKQSLQSLQGMAMDDSTRYKSAFAMAKTMGATPAKLLKSANHYVNVLKKEQSKFKEALVNQRKSQIQGREAKIKSVETAIQEKKAQIKKLMQEIEKKEKDLDKLKEEINKSAAKVESTNERFHLAFNVVMGQIAHDVEKMKEFLK
ncbi:MAG: hypothetical protein HKN68_11495 [Saprospiraceae bacterium]|nr:hypothetical protein [Saprospiraceae bacterium]